MANTGGEAEWSGQAIDARKPRQRRPVGPPCAPSDGWMGSQGRRKEEGSGNPRRTRKTLAAWAVPFDVIKQDRRKA